MGRDSSHRDRDQGEWLEDRMFGPGADPPRGRRLIAPDERPDLVIATWMLGIFRKTGGLTQKQAVWGIRELFGPAYLTRTAHGGWTIPRGVLTRFRSLDPEGIVWSARTRAWRRRQPTDAPARNVP